MSNIQTFKFAFTAEIGLFSIKAKISSPIYVTWKRSQESAKSNIIEMVEGKADFNKEVITLPVNMYYEKVAESFQEKKSSFTFTMNTPKGEKLAGVVYIDLSKLLNNKLEELSDDYSLEKCPVKESKVHIRITSECLGEKASDTMSQASMIDPLTNSSILPDEQTQKSVIQDSSSESRKDREIKSLQQKVEILTKSNQRMQKQLESMKETISGNSMKQQLLKSKRLQDQLESEVQNLRREKSQHEKQLQCVRLRLEEAYQNMSENLSAHLP